MTTKELQIRDGGGELSLEGIEHTRKQLDLFTQLVNSTLIRDQDYGVIPGTKDWSLLKPGAANIIAAFGCHAEPTEPVDKTLDLAAGFLSYSARIEVVLNHRDPTVRIVRAVGNGECNTYEDKYRYRNASPVCPQCGQENIRVSKQGSGYYCWAKTGGCGANFDATDEAITTQKVGKVESENPMNQANTILKMAKKRAMVDAALQLPGVARFFTQDMEEVESAGDGSAPPRPERPAQPRKAARPPTRPVDQTSTTETEPQKLGDLLPWASKTHGLNGPQVFALLQVKNTGEIDARYDLMEAVTLINTAQGQVIEGEVAEQGEGQSQAFRLTGEEAAW